jgi:hypothetical protein
MPRTHDEISIWRPPSGWTEVGAGVWIPPTYRASRWEIGSVPIRSRDEARADYAKCLKSATYFAVHHVWTVDVDDPSGDSIRKMPAFPHLRRFFDAMMVPSNTHVEKSRQMLMSWAWMALFLWDILFHDNWPDLVISKRAKDVDDGGINSTTDSNLGKMRFMYEHLPQHLWAPFEIKHYKIRNIARDSHVTGETGVGGKASRGPTFKRALMDEAAYIERSGTVFKGVRQAAKTGTCLNSTPNGKGNVFYELKVRPNTTFKKYTFHWSEHPRKAANAYCGCGQWRVNPRSTQLPHEQYAAHRRACTLPVKERRIRSPWYDESARDMRPEYVASELDISYEQSQRGRVWPSFDYARNTFDHTLCRNAKTGQVVGERRASESEDAYRMRYLLAAIDPTLPPVVGWDFGIDPSATAMVFGQVVNADDLAIRWIDLAMNLNQSYRYYGQFYMDVWDAAWRKSGGPMWWHIQNYGDPAGKTRGSDLRSWISNLRSAPYNIGIVPSPIKGNVSKLDWLDYLDDLFDDGATTISTFATASTMSSDEKYRMTLIDAVEQFHFPLNEQGEPIPGKFDPVDDVWSHPCDAKRYVYQGRWPHRIRVRSPTAAAHQRRTMGGTGRGSNIVVTEW